MIEEKVFGFLTKTPSFLRKPVLKVGGYFRVKTIKGLKTPLNLILYVTSRCNARCSHCFYWKNLNKVDEMNLEDIEKISSSLKHRLNTLILTGGEPFLRQDIKKICEIFHKRNKTRRITLATNGILTEKITREVSDIVKKVSRLHIQISLDGPERVHDKIRGVKCYKKIIATIENLVKIQKKHKNLEISVMTTICNKNYGVIEKFSMFLQKNFPTLLHKFNVLRGSHFGTYSLNKEIISDLDFNCGVKAKSPEELGKLFLKLRQISSEKKDMWSKIQKLKWLYSVKMLKDNKKLLTCTAAKTFGVIYSNGDFSFCEPTVPFANLKQFNFNLYRLLSSKEANKRREEIKNCYCIHPCNLLDSMSYDTKSISRALRV